MKSQTSYNPKTTDIGHPCLGRQATSDLCRLPIPSFWSLLYSQTGFELLHLFFRFHHDHKPISLSYFGEAVGGDKPCTPVDQYNKAGSRESQLHDFSPIH